MKVCVDPGHGMSNRTPGVFDPGAVHRENGTLFQEADIALRYGLTMKDVLRARGIPVFMTRDDNSDAAPVGARAAAARDAGCDVFLSFHMNDVEDDAANGTETLYRDDADRVFATRVQNALVRTLGLRDRGPKVRTNLAVLRFQGAAVLIELGFIGNDRDRNRILEPQARAAACEAVADAVQALFGSGVATGATAAVQPAVMAATDTPEELIEPKEHDWGGGDRAPFAIDAPLIAGAAPLTLDSYRALFGDVGVRENFNMAAFENLVRGWGLRHFTPAEFLFLGSSHHGVGPCSGLNSLPPQRVWSALENTARMIDEIRERFGHPIRIISGYRDPDYNTCVGGEDGSYHTRYNALDFTNLGGTLREMYAISLRVRDSRPEFLGGIGYYPGSRFVHIDTRGRRSDW